MKSTIFAAFLIGCGGGSFDSSFGGSLHGDAGALGDAEPSSSGGALGAGGAAPEAGGANSGGSSEARDAGSGGFLEAGDAGSGGSLETGGASSSGGAPSAGGAVATGGVTTGGAPAAGGVPAAGGTAPCEEVTHHNGLGQTWTDCVPLRTWNVEQATKACRSTGPDTYCYTATNFGCGAGEFVVGRDVGTWGATGPMAGNVTGPFVSGSCAFICPCSIYTWE